MQRQRDPPLYQSHADGHCSSSLQLITTAMCCWQGAIHLQYRFLHVSTLYIPSLDGGTMRSADAMSS